MQKNNEKQTRNKKSKDGKKIHPKVSYLALNVYDESGIKYSDALEQYALLIATDNTTLLTKKEIALFKIEMLEQEIDDIEEETAKKLEKKRQLLLNAKNDLREIELTLDNYLPSESANLERALDETMKLISKTRKEAEGKKWGIKKVPIKEIDDIAKTNHVKLVTLLAKINKQVKKDWIDI